MLGIDLGRRRRDAVGADGMIYAATEVDYIRLHYPKVRRSLQFKGTKGARHTLKRLPGHEWRQLNIAACGAEVTRPEHAGVTPSVKVEEW